MVTELAVAEIISFLGAILLAATASATARGLSDKDKDERPLHAFKKFYIDLAGAFTALALLSAEGPASWTRSQVLANITSLNGAIALLPLAIGLLLVSLLVARHRWGPRTRKADLLSTVIVGGLILIAVMGLTSKTSATQSFDNAAQKALSSYCSGHSSEVSEILRLANILQSDQGARSPKARKHDSQPLQPDAAMLMRLLEQVAVPADGTAPMSDVVVSAGISRRTKKRVRGELCDALAMYLIIRTRQDHTKIENAH